MDSPSNLRSSLISRSTYHIRTASDDVQQYPDTTFNQLPGVAVGLPSSARLQQAESFLGMFTPYGTPASLSQIHTPLSVDSQSDGSETGLVAPGPPDPTISSSFATCGRFPLSSLASGSQSNVFQGHPYSHSRALSRPCLIPPPTAVPSDRGCFVYPASYTNVRQPAHTAGSKLVPKYIQPRTLPVSPNAGLLSPSLPLEPALLSHTRRYSEADALHLKNMQTVFAIPHAFGDQYQATSAVSPQFPKQPGSPPALASAYHPAAWSTDKVLESSSHTQDVPWIPIMFFPHHYLNCKATRLRAPPFLNKAPRRRLYGRMSIAALRNISVSTNRKPWELPRGFEIKGKVTEKE
ncbi:hypothetical protein F5148DRAFT_740736 [Russula earlei]|uniref:Uncharacterized protein n=1 Tax=Russula earlei TaxID=71964 RepID=A0ACC0UFE0_9AGAM|nr:hypothetical protein F5148DRAFT_740736 [Russula earlei]